MRFLAVAVLSAVLCAAQDAKVERGRYLVEEVAKCQDCHTPKMESGAYIKSQWMKGTTIAFTPVSQPPNWKPKAPDVTANSPIMKRWGVEGMAKFMETGKNPRGAVAGAPMPAYTLSKDDAEAVAAFLNSIP